jgi:hypothetical protein
VCARGRPWPTGGDLLAQAERLGQASSREARRRAKGHVMTWRDYVEWAIVAISFAGMSVIPVVLNLAVTGWDLSRVSWVAWALSAWLCLASVVGMWGAIADRDRPAREQGRQDHTRM